VTARRDSLGTVATALRALHRALAERERRGVEERQGAIIGAGEWLQRVVRDPELAWLRVLSELIVDLDVFLEADPGPADDDAAAIRAEIERLLAPPLPGDSGGAFAQRYWAYVHDDPRVGVAHGEVRQAIDRLPQSNDVTEADSLHERHGWTEARRHRS
jgi:hypothetical protein